MLTNDSLIPTLIPYLQNSIRSEKPWQVVDLDNGPYGGWMFLFSQEIGTTLLFYF